MVIIYAILLIFSFGSGLAQYDIAGSSNSLQAEATVEIQYSGEVGSGIILIHPASCTISDTSNSITNTLFTSTTSPSTTPIWTSSASSNFFNTPPIFGTSQMRIINATSTSQYLFQTATGPSQTMIIFSPPTLVQLLG
jgi:hypothetical protein